MPKKCILLQREAHVQDKSVKNWRVRALLDVLMSFCVAGTGDCEPCQKWATRGVLWHLILYYTTQITLHYATLHYTNYTTTTTTTTLHHTTLQDYTSYIALHYATPHSTPFHSDAIPTTTATTTTTLLDTKLHYTTLPYMMYTRYNRTNTTTTTLHHSYTSITLQLQLHYTTLHPTVVGEVTAATNATTPNNTTPTTFGPSMDSLCHPGSTSPIGFLFVKLAPPLCAVLLVHRTCYTGLDTQELLHRSCFTGDKF